MPELSFEDIRLATAAGSPDKPSEDWANASSSLLVVLDGATARTETGCVHGVHWYAARLGTALVDLAADPGMDLADVLRRAIARVAAEHPACDLTHPGTPSAGVALLRADGRYLVLGDVTIAGIGADGPFALVDPRVEQTARPEREEVDRHLIGTPEKAAALIPMKRAELAARNVPGGYWIAAADPEAAEHALTGHLDVNVSPVALLTDGAARAVTLGLMNWSRLLYMAAAEGPDELIAAVRRAEASDPLGAKWPRNKTSDDATVVLAHRR
ncbi:protein phosphatase 2C domain-containing protein [Catellatospora coxensis]|uniref:Protein phosphatase 2C-like protein n=1 Tax=Catellatospora coxensis TaxID=310354 RepID=A0A8J3PC61_9ACTN|nr:protein phosphatase 2C domain-containing protein [Catellatospora coxensis]GIG11058.1 hypothetical protein Cco03nite_77580 [Catellatospora coxensis]